MALGANRSTGCVDGSEGEREHEERETDLSIDSFAVGEVDEGDGESGEGRPDEDQGTLEAAAHDSVVNVDDNNRDVVDAPGGIGGFHQGPNDFVGLAGSNDFSESDFLDHLGEPV